MNREMQYQNSKTNRYRRSYNKEINKCWILFELLIFTSTVSLFPIWGFLALESSGTNSVAVPPPNQDQGCNTHASHRFQLPVLTTTSIAH